MKRCCIVLAERFLPPDRVRQMFGSGCSPRQLESTLEHELAAVVGSASFAPLLDLRPSAGPRAAGYRA